MSKHPVILSAKGETISLQPPLLRVLQQAMAQQATDVHLDPMAEGKLVRFRVDGALHEFTRLTDDQPQRILNQIKVAANLSIETSFLPQDGQITVHDGNTKQDLRVSIVPVGGRTAVHLRFLGGRGGMRNITQLGLSRQALNRVTDNLHQTHGMTLVAGPTGAGKTVTLYALAEALDLRSKVVCSIEDPVEFRLPGIRQIEVDDAHGLTMSAGLRSMLRMDADVILVGEIRDQTSAITASRAALTSRTVLATIHAASARMAIDAMRSLAVPRYLLAGALHQIIHQDLIRTLCPECKQPMKPDPTQRKLFASAGMQTPETLYQPTGCEQCHGYGYRGRTGVFEILTIEDRLRREIATGTPEPPTEPPAPTRSPLILDAMQKCAAGITSMEEVLITAAGHHEKFSPLDDAS